MKKLREMILVLVGEGKMMGHDNVKTTTIYLAASSEHLSDQMTRHPLNN